MQVQVKVMLLQGYASMAMLADASSRDLFQRFEVHQSLKGYPSCVALSTMQEQIHAEAAAADSWCARKQRTAMSLQC